MWINNPQRVIFAGMWVNILQRVIISEKWSERISMNNIVFIDTEVEPNSGKILDIGGVAGNGAQYHSTSIPSFIQFIQGSRFICGHNIFQHDLKYIQHELDCAGLNEILMIDTLYFSPLLFPVKPYHSLLKDDKLQTEEINNPLNDSIKVQQLFLDEVTAFHKIDSIMKSIFFILLKDKREFSSFFHFVGYNEVNVTCANGEYRIWISDTDHSIAGYSDLELAYKTLLSRLIREKFSSVICEHADLLLCIEEHPVELAYCLALINTHNRYSITPPWVLKNFPAVERIMFILRNSPCLAGCPYCNEALDIHLALKRFFGFDSYRTYAGEPLQEKAVQAAVNNKSLLAVFPTGGGKSITFQIPALMSGTNAKGLTVVISPLQSLMKDQVDNLEKAGITEAVTINGLLDPIERAKSLERVENGTASLLYISPESLRSRTIEHLLLGRNVVRFVIDEAHCFSSWGQDFRVDYLYIGDFIKMLQEKKNLQDPIPVSCFTATAKQMVVEDIRRYFRDRLSIELDIFRSGASRSNLRYQVIGSDSDEEKYNTLRDLLEEKRCPTIVYVSRTYRAYSLAKRLTEDGFPAKPYHGQMDKQEKTENQDAFIRGEVQIMVATSAFGMGVDKKDVGMVIHYEISDSLENYVQEAGRAGRDESISADCFVLYNDEDLGKHFIMLNQTKLSIREIRQIWKAIKEITRFRMKVSQSALEIARKAGWDESINEIETRVKTAILALEQSGYIKRGQNMPRIFANSILAKNAAEAVARINASGRFDEKQKQKAVRIMKKLFSSKSRAYSSDEEAESRVDYISDHLGIVKEEVIQIINLLREEKILADMKDLSAYVRKKENTNRSLGIYFSFTRLERFLLEHLAWEERTYHIKELNENASEAGCTDTSPLKIKTILNLWAVKNWIKKHNDGKDHIVIMPVFSRESLEEKLIKRNELAKFIVEYLFDHLRKDSPSRGTDQEEVMAEFSVLELKDAFENRGAFINTQISADDVEDALFYLSRIESIKIEGGFMVLYSGMSIERLEQDTRKQYKEEDYKTLREYYENKTQQIHIVGEYAKKMLDNYRDALQFVDDYFQLNYASFLNKYFRGSRQSEIKKNITPMKFRQLFGELSPAQLQIIHDRKSKYIVVAAGPGSGKTRILVHKLASLMLMEDVKHEQLLMLTFSRSAVTEFKKRLLRLIGNAANFIEIKTFHSYCFDLLGRVGTLEDSVAVISEAVEKITNGEVEPGRITKSVLVIDEAQDMDASEFALIQALMHRNDEMRIIAVGDDDQNIYEFRGSSSQYLFRLIEKNDAVRYELVNNYRSKSNLVAFTNRVAERLTERLKDTPICAVQSDTGKIRLIRYRSMNLIPPLVEDVIGQDLSGTTGILTRSNDEALQITGMLVKNGMRARLIQSIEEFSLYNLLEIRFFLHQLHLEEGVYTIDDDTWANAKRSLADRFGSSPHLEMCSNLLRSFEQVNPKHKFVSSLEIFIRESKLEDFIENSVEAITVSTMHKAKGREFDNVFLMLDRFHPQGDPDYRLLYVAMTRAKRFLTIHHNGSFIDTIEAKDAEIIDDRAEYGPPDQLAIQLLYKDIYLDFFQSCQDVIRCLSTGDDLTIQGKFCFNAQGFKVLEFSKQGMSRIESAIRNGYAPLKARVKVIVLWKKENTEKEIRIILPELNFKKSEQEKLC